MCDEIDIASSLKNLQQKLETEQTAARDQKAFTRFKQAAMLVGQAAEGAEDWEDVTFQLENAFSHPLYEDSRLDFANALGAAITTGIEIALE